MLVFSTHHMFSFYSVGQQSSLCFIILCSHSKLCSKRYLQLCYFANHLPFETLCAIVAQPISNCYLYLRNMRILSLTAITQKTMLMLWYQTKFYKLHSLSYHSAPMMYQQVMPKSKNSPQQMLCGKSFHHTTHTTWLQLYADQLIAFNASSTITRLGCMHPATAHLLLGRVHVLRSSTAVA